MFPNSFMDDFFLEILFMRSMVKTKNADILENAIVAIMV